MEQSVIYALDFDGVICDSAVETGISGWKAATRIWDDMKGNLPKQQLIDQFRLVRPLLETGYESILIMRMLFEGDDIESIQQHFVEKKQHTLAKSKQSTDVLKQLFGETRDTWINNSLDEWIQMNPLFKGVDQKLMRLSRQNTWYIVTTKQERFVSQILKANQIDLPDEHIFGLDRKIGKETVLQNLQDNHPDQIIYFVEDRLPALLNVLQNDKLQDVKLFFASWGYNTRKDKIEAAQNPIELIGLDNFLN